MPALTTVRILRENIRDRHTKHRGIFNLTIGKILASATQVDEFRRIRAQFITQRLAEGASMQQAEQESKEVEVVYKTVTSKLQRLEASRQKLEQAIKKHEKTLKTQQQKKSNELISLKLSISQNSIQEVQTALMEYKYELERAKLAVQDKSLFQNCSAISKKYLIEAGTEFCKFADSAIGIMNAVGYVAGELVIPGGWAGVEAYDKGATVGDAVEIQKKAIGDEFAVAQAFGAGGAAGYIGYKLNKCYKALKAMPVLKPNFVSKLYSRMVTRKLPSAEKQVAKEMEILFNRYKWTDPKTGLTRNVYVGNEFDPFKVVSMEGKNAGETNIERMKRNLSPVGFDDNSVNWHHVLQNEKGDLVCLSDTAHKKYSKLLHSHFGYGKKNSDNPVIHDKDWDKTRGAINQFIAEVIERGKFK